MGAISARAPRAGSSAALARRGAHSAPAAGASARARAQLRRLLPQRRRRALAHLRPRPLHLFRCRRRPALRGRPHARRDPRVRRAPRLLPAGFAGNSPHFGRGRHRQRHPREEPSPRRLLRAPRSQAGVAALRRRAERARARRRPLRRDGGRPRPHGSRHLGGDCAGAGAGAGRAGRGDSVRRARGVLRHLGRERRALRVHGRVARRAGRVAPRDLLPRPPCSRGDSPSARASHGAVRCASRQRLHRARVQRGVLRGPAACGGQEARPLRPVLLPPRRRRPLESPLWEARLPAVPVRGANPRRHPRRARRGGAPRLGLAADGAEEVRRPPLAGDAVLPAPGLHRGHRSRQPGRADLRAVRAPREARRRAETFARSYPRLSEFERFVDPAFSSSFWRRVAR